ncbi:PrgI family protein [Candidatus Saccharibacteria bacterium]|nr:PrgI family protein [Candidatus Saccharibacteria bacterium]
MAQYKVPQDVEADDKLLGPFSFRQFVYLMITGGLIALAVGLFQLFPFLALIPVPGVLFFGALALPLRKDQPMETYFAAIVSYYIKPHKRFWTPGQRESTIQITAPKIVEESRIRSITGEEATHRLSFLADVVDTKGYSIKGASTSLMREDLVAEANATSDMFENARFNSLETAIAKEETERHNEVVSGMRAAIERNDGIMGSSFGAPTIQNQANTSELNAFPEMDEKPNFNSPVVVVPGMPVEEAVKKKAEEKEEEKKVEEKTEEKPEEKKEEKVPPAEPNHSIIELANNPDYSVATIAKEAKRIKERDEGEVFISLH